jgi:hypothetical protein
MIESVSFCEQYVIMKIKEIFSYRNVTHTWIKPLIVSLEKVSDNLFFEQDGSPRKQEISQLDVQLFELLRNEFGEGIEKNVATMLPSKFNVDMVLPTNPATLIEIEKGKLPRLELDLMKITNSIYKYPSLYGYGCLIVPMSYITLKLAGGQTPFEYVTKHLIPLNSKVLDCKSKNGSFLIKDLIVIGYFDPRAESIQT